jgi:hypothetical protein
MTRIEPIYFAALVVAVAAALGFQLINLPHPWPAALALNVYGLVAWPGMSRELHVSERTYAGGWMCLALVLVCLEKLAPLVQ